jgi:hypothetical protein
MHQLRDVTDVTSAVSSSIGSEHVGPPTHRPTPQNRGRCCLASLLRLLWFIASPLWMRLALGQLLSTIRILREVRRRNTAAAAGSCRFETERVGSALTTVVCAPHLRAASSTQYQHTRCFNSIQSFAYPFESGSFSLHCSLTTVVQHADTTSRSSHRIKPQPHNVHPGVGSQLKGMLALHVTRL